MVDERARVLIVDDDPVVRELLAAVLDDGESDLVEAADGFEALRLAAERHPDVVVLDVMMPGMTGFEVARRIRANPELSKTTIVILTALDTASSRSESESAGADAYVTKPFSALDLIKLVQSRGVPHASG